LRGAVTARESSSRLGVLSGLPPPKRKEKKKQKELSCVHVQPTH